MYTYLIFGHLHIFVLYRNQALNNGYPDLNDDDSKDEELPKPISSKEPNYESMIERVECSSDSDNSDAEGCDSSDDDESDNESVMSVSEGNTLDAQEIDYENRTDIKTEYVTSDSEDSSDSNPESGLEAGSENGGDNFKIKVEVSPINSLFIQSKTVTSANTTYLEILQIMVRKNRWGYACKSILCNKNCGTTSEADFRKWTMYVMVVSIRV